MPFRGGIKAYRIASVATNLSGGKSKCDTNKGLSQVQLRYSYVFMAKYAVPAIKFCTACSTRIFFLVGNFNDVKTKYVWTSGHI